MEICLGKNETMAIAGDARRLSISCPSGTLWLTQQGDPGDYLIESGQRFTVNRKGKVVIVAMCASSLMFNSAFCKCNMTSEKFSTLFLHGKLNFFKRPLWRGHIG